MEDKEIVDLYFERNEEALRHTEETYGSFCRHLSFNILHNRADAEECVNDTWVRTWNSIPPERPYSLRAYLAKITRNLSFDRYEKMHAQKRGSGETAVILDELAECIPSDASVEEEVHLHQLTEAITRFLAGCTEQQRILFVRRYFFNESLRDISSRTGITRGNAKTILYRMRTDLREFLKQEDYIQ